MSLRHIKDKLTDILSNSIASWQFIVCYTMLMIVWVILHEIGWLHIDNASLTRYNLFLSWWAGIQASIVLMTANRQSEIDRLTGNKTLRITEMLKRFDEQNGESIRRQTVKLNKIMDKIDKMEEIITLMEKEENEEKK